ncbi:unnamed protein product [Tenebrio molitor]|nr:unnamed protein product [Tenebrio molitor]
MAPVTSNNNMEKTTFANKNLEGKRTIWDRGNQKIFTTIRKYVNMETPCTGK